MLVFSISFSFAVQLLALNSLSSLPQSDAFVPLRMRPMTLTTPTIMPNAMPKMMPNSISKSNSNSISNQHVHHPQHGHSTKLHALPPSLSNSLASLSALALPASVSLSLPSIDIAVDKSALAQFFFETLISYGVPAFFWIVVIGFAAKSFRGSRRDNANSNSSGPNGNLFGTSGSNVITELYDDLYGSSSSNANGGMMDGINMSPFAAFSPNRKNTPPKNLGIPKTQYLQITKLNDIYSSYTYSLTAATESKAKAAAQYRSKAFDSALQRAFDSSVVELNTAQKSDLLLEEKEFLNKGGEILSEIVGFQTLLTDLVIKDEMEDMDVEIGEVDTHNDDDDDSDDEDKKGIIDATIVGQETSTSSTDTTTATATATATAITSSKKGDKKKKKKNKSSKKEINKLVKEIEKQNTELLRLEIEFIRAVVEVMGPVSYR